MNFNINHFHYLSHPYTSYGSKSHNLFNSIKLAEHLKIEHQISLINVIDVLPRGLDNDAAMKKCIKILESCDAVIFCPGWKESKGCIEEYAWAKTNKLTMYEVLESRKIVRLEA